MNVKQKGKNLLTTEHMRTKRSGLIRALTRFVNKLVILMGLVTLSMLTPAAYSHDFGNLSEDGRAQLRQEIRDYLLTNPEILIEAFSLLESRQAAAELEQSREAILANAELLFNNPNSWQGGNPEGDITIVEFIDYRCGYCRKAHTEIQELLATDPGIRMIVKEYPILSQESFDSAKLALAALRNGGQDAYKLAHDFLIGFNGEIDSDLYANISTLTGIDQDVLTEDIASADIENIIIANYQLADSLGISGTPAFVIGSTLHPGYAPLDQMRQMIAEERARSE
ncbi:MAG: DsbA family protein [Rhodobacteraceae bacterium]|nr:DsbA family protein [Paracoccaceae bacterium]